MSSTSEKTTPPTGAIYLALASVMRDIQAIGKDKKNESQGFYFRGIDDCYNALHPIFSAHGLLCLPLIEKIDASEYVNTKGNKGYRTHVTMRYRFICATDGSYVDAVTVGEGMDFGDKSTAKAMSVAHKYALLQTLLIPTKDLVDGDAYDPTIDPKESLRRENDRIMYEERTRFEELGIDPALSEPMETRQTPPATEQKKPYTEAAAATAKKPSKPKAAPVETAPVVPAEDAWKEVIIDCINHKDFSGQKLGDLSPASLQRLKKWVDLNKERIMKDAHLQDVANAILLGVQATSK